MKKIILGIAIGILIILSIKQVDAASKRFWIHNASDTNSRGEWIILDDTATGYTCYSYGNRNGIDCVKVK